jgi:uncharacterized membrane protein
MDPHHLHPHKETLQERQDRHAFERLTYLVDGVFAIAMTLLALDLKPQGVIGGGWEGLINNLAPKLAAYVISFFVIATFWFNQRRNFSRYDKVNGPMAWFTMLFLGLVVLVPVSSNMMYTHPGLGSQTIYLWLIGLISGVQALTWAYAAFVAKLVSPEVNLVARIYIFLTGALAPTAFAGVSFFAMQASGSTATMAWCAMAAMVIVLGFLSRRLMKGLR